MNAPVDRNIDANDVMAEIEDVIRAIPKSTNPGPPWSILNGWVA